MDTAHSSKMRLFRLEGSLQKYDWGKVGEESLVAQLAPEAIGPDFKSDGEQAYAEVWMGTHSNGPSCLFDSPNKTLLEQIKSDPQHYLGTHLASTKLPSSDQRFSVPFLFKILSIAKALPLQAHPDKELGAQLKQKDPEQFVDANHKPEIAVALKDGFKGFVGFQPVSRIAKHIEEIQELRDAIGDENAVSQFLKSPTKSGLKAVFSALLQQRTTAVAACVERLLSRLKDSKNPVDPGLSDLVLTLNGQYPKDVGVLAAPFFMNMITLNRGEAIYIPADDAHAYLEGDIIECMATSDNVLNAAFVPPDTRNMDVFTTSLTYTAREEEYWRLNAVPYESSQKKRTIKYDPPMEEFVVLWTRVGPMQQLVDDDTGDEVLSPVSGPTIGIVLSGSASFGIKERTESRKREHLHLTQGGVFYLTPGHSLSIKNTGTDELDVALACYSQSS